MWALEVGLGIFGQGIPKYLECGPEGVWGVGRGCLDLSLQGTQPEEGQSGAFQRTGLRAWATPAWA